MERDLLSWLINELDEMKIQKIAKFANLKVDGFSRNLLKCPKSLLITNLLKNREDLLKGIKKLSNDLDAKRELDGKSISEIRAIIDINDKEKLLEQIIYLISKDTPECKAIINEILNNFREINTEKNISNLEITNNNRVNNMEQNQSNVDKYIVTVEEKYGFYNIYPLYKIEKDQLIKINSKDYPDFGNININPWQEFSKKNYDQSSLWICKFSPDELEETKNKTKYKIDGDLLIKNKAIYDINDEEIYEIAELIEDRSDLKEELFNNKIGIKNKPIKEFVYINDDNYIYGPFKYGENSRGGGYYIDQEKNDYIVEKYSIKKNQDNLSIIEIENPYVYRNSYIKAVYIKNKKDLIGEKIDTISDQQLFEKLKRIINTKNTLYSKDELEKIRKSFDSIINNFMSEERRNRIKNFIEETKTTDTFIDIYLIDIINGLLENNNTKENIVEKILNQHDILRKLQNYESVQAKIDIKTQDLKIIQQELEYTKEELEKKKIEIKEAIDNFNNENMQKLIEENKSDIEDMITEKKKIEKDIEELTKKYNLCKEIEGLFKEKMKIEVDAKKEKSKYDTFFSENEKMKEQAEKIEKDIKSKLENVTNQYSDITFDGMIANEMLESAAKWSKKKYLENFENQIASKERVEKLKKIKSFQDENIIDYIYNEIKEIREYSKNDLINIMICLTQGFLTVFAGEPGVGKTSICNIIAEILGLKSKDGECNRFAEISVEKGWTSKRDLIGYYNPLTKSFDKNNSLLFKTFNVLHQEYINGINDFPYYILLDEANLSSMEYYWADFMNVCDLDKENRRINLGEDYIYDIPKTLRFLATINYDHTTETLSPRLVDRAWIILLEGNDLSYFSDKVIKEQKNNYIVLFEDLEKYFSNLSYNELEEELISKIYEELDEIYSVFKDNNISISSRISNMIKKYLKVGCKIFEKTESTWLSEFVALDYAVAQKLLPKINGYGDEYRKFLKTLEDKFDKNNMMKCKNIIGNIIKKGDTNMQYYQFFS